MEWLSFIAMICLSSPSNTGVSRESCESYHKVCVERLVAQSETLDNLSVAQAFYTNPETRAACSKVIK